MDKSGESLFAQLLQLFEQDKQINELGLVISPAEFLPPQTQSVQETDNTSIASDLATEYASQSETCSIEDGDVNSNNNNNNNNEHEHDDHDVVVEVNSGVLVPSPFLLIDHKLAIAYWCIPELYKYAFALCRKEFKERKESGKSFSVKSLRDASSVVLLISPDNYTVLNMRKELILSSDLNTTEELKLLDLVFTKHPKSGEAWAHRRWVLERIDKKEFPSVVEHELSVSLRVAEIYPKNYYAWSHRLWLIENLHDSEVLRTWLYQDLKIMEEWTRRHISDNCGFHHRRYLLSKISSLHSHNNNNNNDNNSPSHALKSNPIYELLSNEIRYINELVEFYPGHETLWLHKRFLILFLYNTLKIHLIPSFSFQEFGLPSVAEEIKFADSCIEDDEASNFEAQKTYALTFKLWVLELILMKIGGDKFNISKEDIAHHFKLTLQNLRVSQPNQCELWKKKEQLFF